MAVIARDGGCTFSMFAQGRATDQELQCHGPLTAHELRKRSHGADPTNPDECVCLCWGHNGWIEDNPRVSAAWGLWLTNKTF